MAITQHKIRIVNTLAPAIASGDRTFFMSNNFYEEIQKGDIVYFIPVYKTLIDDNSDDAIALAKTAFEVTYVTYINDKTPEGITVFSFRKLEDNTAAVDIADVPVYPQPSTKWIKLSDEKPLQQTCYLTYTPGMGIRIQYWNLSKQTFDVKQDFVPYPTHWMELPDMPLWEEED